MWGEGQVPSPVGQSAGRTSIPSPARHSFLATCPAYCLLQSLFPGLEMRWRKPPEPSSSFQERCRLRRSWGYFGELGSNPAWRGRVGTTIPPGLGIWEASEVQARSGRGAEAGEQGRYPLPSIDPSTGVCTGRTPSHSLEGVGSLAKNSHECCDRKNGTQRRATVGQRGHGRRCTSS